MKAQVGMIGLGVMGAGLARNIARNGFCVAVYNRSYAVTESFLALDKEGDFVVAKELEEFVSQLERPRRIFLMIKAGDPVDLVTEALLPLLAADDIIIDAGNSYYKDTNRREVRCASERIHFVGLGVSGGAKGALEGPSLMPGGSKQAYESLWPIYREIAAKDDGPCAAHMGPGGAGHFVKMVHNGIEYADMQLIAEAFSVLNSFYSQDREELASLFEKWQRGPLSSYLIDITSNILRYKDKESDQYLVDLILDKSEQKGTGRWTIEAALELGVAVPSITTSVEARILSSYKEQRVKGAQLFGKTEAELKPHNHIEKLLEMALYSCKLIAYSQGLSLIEAASEQFGWDTQISEVARTWRAGCIIRAELLKEIQALYSSQRPPSCLIFAQSINDSLSKGIEALREVLAICNKGKISAPAMSGSLMYFDSLTSERLPHNLIQAQRDYFGAHTYRRIDKEGVFHTAWDNNK
jgi:6-phosphogluconate dehydrogenase